MIWIEKSKFFLGPHWNGALHNVCRDSTCRNRFHSKLTRLAETPFAANARRGLNMEMAMWKMMMMLVYSCSSVNDDECLKRIIARLPIWKIWKCCWQGGADVNLCYFLLCTLGCCLVQFEKEEVCVKFANIKRGIF